MRVKVAAIVHFDPLCRGRLLSWLRILLGSQSSPPAFIAVEWDEQHFEEVKKQRPKALERAQSLWPDATDNFYATLEKSVGFEADTHKLLIPNAKIRWLDQDRPLPHIDTLKNYAIKRIEGYFGYVGGDTTLSDSELLKKMSIKAWNDCGSRKKGETDRDKPFAEAISKNSGSDPSLWSIAVVGADHASRDPGYMVALLEEKEIKCDVKILSPDNDANIAYKGADQV